MTGRLAAQAPWAATSKLSVKCDLPPFDYSQCVLDEFNKLPLKAISPGGLIGIAQQFCAKYLMLGVSFTKKVETPNG